VDRWIPVRGKDDLMLCLVRASKSHEREEEVAGEGRREDAGSGVLGLALGTAERRGRPPEANAPGRTSSLLSTCAGAGSLAQSPKNSATHATDRSEPSFSVLST
jgi:hypothetical protein